MKRVFKRKIYNKMQTWKSESSGYRTHASLDAFCKKYSDRIGARYLIYTKDYTKDGATTLLPVFMTPFI